MGHLFTVQIIKHKLVIWDVYLFKIIKHKVVIWGVYLLKLQSISSYGTLIC